MRTKVRTGRAARYAWAVALKRPKTETERINFKVAPERKKAYETAAGTSEQKMLSTWIKAVLDAELERLKRRGKK